MRVEILEPINGVYQVSAVTDKPNDQPVRVARYGPKVAIRVDGVWLTGQQKIDGQLLRLKKQAADRNNAAVTHEFYALAGVSGVNAENVGAINSALNTASVSSQSLQGVSGLQQVVDAYNRILSKAQHPPENPTPTDPSASDYSTIGADIGTARVDADKLIALNQAVAALTPAHVDTVAEIESLARALNATQNAQERQTLVQAWLSLEGPLPTPSSSADAFGFH